jgi:hypothetical protein
VFGEIEAAEEEEDEKEKAWRRRRRRGGRTRTRGQGEKAKLMSILHKTHFRLKTYIAQLYSDFKLVRTLLVFEKQSCLPKAWNALFDPSTHMATPLSHFIEIGY